MSCYILPEGSYFDSDDMLRNKDGVLLPDGLYKNGENVILYEGIFNESMAWGSNDAKRIEEPIIDEKLLRKAN